MIKESRNPEDINWREEILASKVFNEKDRNLLKNGAKSLTDSWWLQALYVRWKKLKGYKDPDIQNKGQFQSKFKDLGKG